MSNKRQATTDLNHDNWDQDDPADHEEMGTYKVADKEVLAKRVIRTAKRRTPMSSPSVTPSLNADESKKSVFSGFGGFNKTQPSSFDFLANLTNGNKTNGSSENKTDSSGSSSLFNNNKSPVNTSSSGFFSIPVTTAASKPTFGSPSTQASSIFKSSPVTTTASLFTVKTDSKVDSPFKSPASTKTDTSGDFPFKTNSASPNATQSSPFQKFNPMSFAPTTTSTNSSPFKIQPVSSTATTESTDSNASDKKSEQKNDNDSKKLSYYAKLKGLNESVLSWIKKHVEETPLCILTPIFKDYEKHLKVIQEEYLTDDDVKKDNDTNDVSLSSKNSGSTVGTSSPNKNSASSLFSAITQNSKANSSSSDKSNHATSSDEKPSTPFSFGLNTTSKTTPTSPSTTGFSFGITKTANPLENKSEPAPLSFGSGTPAPFSFGIGQKFSFSPNTIKTDAANEEKTDKEDEDQPPKVEYTPVVEDNSVFEKRCKVFVKKDGNFADKGVGTLYIKKIEEKGKHQLIVRANTNLGTVLVNTILASAIPTQRMGKNNVMMVCIPTPDAKPPPTPILIRVKTAEEADELLETLNNYKA